MSEQAPKVTPEQSEKPDFSTYESTANHFIDSYAGSFADDTERAAFHAEVVEVMQGIEAENFDERVKAYEEIIAGLKERANMKAQKNGEPVPFQSPKAVNQDVDPGEPAENPEQDDDESEGDDTETDKPPKGDDIQERQRLNFFQRANLWVGTKVLSGYAALAARRGKSAEKYSQLPDETDAEYSKRIRKTGFRYNLAFTAITGAVLGLAAARYLGVEHGGGSGAHHDIATPGDNQDQGSNGTPNRSNNPWDADGNGIVDAHEYSIQSHHIESQFLDTSGRHHNDFNKIDLHDNADGTTDMNDLYGQFGEQFRKSPHELASQYDQFHRLGTDLPDDLKELNYKPGETPEQYTERVAELLHGNRELKDKAADFALDQLHGKSLEDLTQDYESNYIIPDGKGGWLIQTDPDVTSADPHDKILVMGKANGYIEGVRIPCGQPIRIPIEVPQAAPQGVGGAAPADYSGQGGADYQPVAHVTPDTPGQGGETPHHPGTPDTPAPDTPTPAPQTPGPERDKDTSLTPNQDGVTVRGLDNGVTEKPAGPEAGDATTTTETGTTTTADTGTSVGAEGADTTRTNESTGNAAEGGMNTTDSSGNAQPNGTISTDQ